MHLTRLLLSFMQIVLLNISNNIPTDNILFYYNYIIIDNQYVTHFLRRQQSMQKSDCCIKMTENGNLHTCSP